MTAPIVEATAAVRARRRLPLPSWLSGWVVAPVAALVAVVVGLLIAAIPSVLAWATATATTSTWAMPFRITGIAWLVGHDVTLTVDTANYSLLPWGFLLVWGWLCVAAGRWAGRHGTVTTLRRAVLVTAIFAAVYASAMALVSVGTATSTTQTNAARAFGIGLAFSAVTAGWGVLRGADLVDDVWDRVPDAVRVALRGAIVGTLVLIGAGAALLALALAMNVPQLLDIQRFLDAGLVGGLVLFLITLGYLPVAIMWSVSYLLGAGLGLGGATVISPFVSSPLPTQLPPLVYFVALPQASTPIAWALPIIGVAAGIVVGLVVARGVRTGALVRLATAAAASAIAALGLAILARLSYGSLGDLRLVHLGPSSQLVALLALIVLLIGSVPAALAFRRSSKDPDVLDADVDEPAGEGEASVDVVAPTGSESIDD